MIIIISYFIIKYGSNITICCESKIIIGGWTWTRVNEIEVMQWKWKWTWNEKENGESQPNGYTVGQQQLSDKQQKEKKLTENKWID